MQISTGLLDRANKNLLLKEPALNVNCEHLKIKLKIEFSQIGLAYLSREPGVHALHVSP